jgi:hypothetical protein
MDDKTAHDIIKQMRDTALAEVKGVEARLKAEIEDYDRSPHIDTAAIIRRLQDRLESRAHEAEALAIAVSKF